MKLKQVIESSPDGFPVVDLPVEAAKDLQGLLNDCGYQLQADGIPGRMTLWAFKSWKVAADQANAEVIGAGSYELLVAEAQERKDAIAQPESEVILYSGKQFQFPGIGLVRTDQPVIASGNFTFGEACHGGVRLPTPEHAKNIIQLAERLQPVREKVGRSMHITSWYRPDPWNAQARGASNSQHKFGLGVDIAMDGEDGRSMLKLFGRDWYNKGVGGVGIYPGVPSIIHLDCRGYPAGWGW